MVMTQASQSTRPFGPLLVALLAAGCGVSAHDASTSAHGVQAVTVIRVTSVELPSHTEAGGIVQSSATAQIASQVVAPIEEINVRVGDRVSRGQPLAILDARELTARADRATAAVTAATEATRASASRATAAEAALDLAIATHARISNLHEKRSATEQELDQAVAALRAAEAQVATARADYAASAASREAARAEAEAAAIMRSYATLAAPFDGRVAERLADPGSLASPGVPFLVLEQADAVRLEVRLDESRAAGIAPGQAAEARLDGDPDQAWFATSVLEVGRVDPVSHSVLVKLQLPPTVSTRTGSFGRARFAGPARPTLVVPVSSLVRRAGLTFVFMVDADGTTHLRPVVTAGIDEARSEVLTGLASQDLVVLNPPPGLGDGDTVRAVQGQTAAPREPRS